MEKRESILSEYAKPDERISLSATLLDMKNRTEIISQLIYAERAPYD